MIIVSNAAQLQNAINSAKGGETIALAPGAYGVASVRGRSFDTPITITSLDPDDPARFDRLKLQEVSGVTLSNLLFDRQWGAVTAEFYSLLQLEKTSRITIAGNWFEGSVVNTGDRIGDINDVGVFGRDVSDSVIVDNEFIGTHRGVAIGGFRDSEIRDNIFDSYRSDALSLDYVDGVVVSRNIMVNPQRSTGDHLDFIQVREVRNMVIESNVMLQGEGSPSQGIFMSKITTGDSYNGNVTIDNNIIYSGMRNALVMTNVADSRISNNVVLGNEMSFHTPHLLVSGDQATNVTVVGNIASGYASTMLNVVSKGGAYRDNLWVQRDNPLVSSFVAQLLANGLADQDARPSDFALIAAAARSGIGIDLSRFAFAESYFGEAKTGAMTKLSVSPTALKSHAPGVQDFGAATATGDAISLSGNAWKTIDMAFEVTARSMLSLDVVARSQAEIYGVGFMRDGVVLERHAFQLGGAHSWGVQAHRQDLAAGQKVSVTLDIGRYVEGAFDGLVLISDADAGPAGDVTYSNIRLDAESLIRAPSALISKAVIGEGVTPTAYQRGVQDFGVARIDGDDLIVGGNGWKTVAGGFFANAGTTLRFDLTAADAGEIVGVGLLRDGVVTPQTTFQLGGSQAWGIQDFRLADSALVGGASIEIPIGRYASGWVDGFVFIVDDDADASGAVRFANIRRLDNPAIADAAGRVAIDFGAEKIASYAPKAQDVGWSKVIEGGDGLSVGGNGWKAIEHTLLLTEDSWVSFEFRAPTTGEIHAIGFESDNTPSPDRFFQLAGDQLWADSLDYRQAGASTQWRAVEIPIGKLIDGDIDRIVFVADSDAGPLGISDFRNVIFHDAVMIGGL